MQKEVGWEAEPREEEEEVEFKEERKIELVYYVCLNLKQS